MASVQRGTPGMKDPIEGSFINPRVILLFRVAGAADSNDILHPAFLLIGNPCDKKDTEENIMEIPVHKF